MGDKKFCQAEEKVCKFRETLTSNVDGNPEPSLENKEGAETRHRLCMKCGKPIPLERYKNAIYCSIRCRANYGTLQYRIRKGLIKKPGVGSGGNQWGKDNHRYKNGIGIFRSIAFKSYDKICNRCKSTKNILVHHIDGDRTNNSIENLEILCKRCHQKHHTVRDTATGQYTKHT